MFCISAFAASEVLEELSDSDVLVPLQAERENTNNILNVTPAGDVIYRDAKFMIYRYLIAVPKQEMFCLPSNVGKIYIPDLFLSLLIGTIVFHTVCFTVSMHLRMC